MYDKMMQRQQKAKELADAEAQKVKIDLSSNE